ncbi:MAG: hypothetical protein Q7V88_16435 [Actinomycetota bacterium]|nr:hypothetical protein [Actinomycetota bacterium]
MAVVKQQDGTAEAVEHALQRDGGELAAPQRLALRLADTLMTLPGELDDATVAELRRHFTDEQLVELTLKVQKFNIQKVLVALDTHEWMTAGRLDELAWNRDGAYTVAG